MAGVTVGSELCLQRWLYANFCIKHWSMHSCDGIVLPGVVQECVGVDMIEKRDCALLHIVV